MEETFLLKSISEDGSILQSKKIQGVEVKPFEDDPYRGKGKIEFESPEGFTFPDPDGHYRWTWERVA